MHWSPWLLVAIGLAIIGAGLGFDLKRQYRDAARIEQERLAAGAALAAHALEQRLVVLARLLARLDTALRANPDDALLIVHAVADLDPQLAALLVVDADGTVIASSSAELQRRTAAGAAFLGFVRADAEPEARMHAARPPSSLGAEGWLLARAWRDADGDFRGALAALVGRDYFAASLPPPGDGGVIELFDADAATIAAHADNVAAGAPALAALATVAPTPHPLDRPWSVRAARTEAAVFAAWGRQARYGLLLWLLVAVVAVLAGLIATLRRNEVRRLRGLHQRLLQGVDEGLCGIDREARLRFANGAFARHVGATPGSLLGRALVELVRWPEGAGDPVSAVLAGELPRHEGDCEIGTAHLRATVTPTREAGVIHGALLAFADPLAAGAEAGAHGSADRLYRTLFDLSPDGVLIVDLDTERPLAFNPAATRLLGHDAESFAAMKVREHEAGAAPMDTIRNLARVLAEGHVEFETRYRHRDGSTREVQVLAQTIEFGGGPALYWIFRDVSAIRRANAELQQHAALMQALLDHLPLPMLVFEQQQLALVNARYLADLGEIAPGSTLEQWLELRCEHPAARAALLMHWQRLDEREDRQAGLELALRGGDGCSRVHDVHLARVGARTLLLLVDLSERRLAEQRLSEARELAERANRARSEFLANMSHEIRTPMTAILGFTYLLQKSGLHPVQCEQTQRIDSAARTLLAILDDLLDYSKLEAGRIQIEQRPFSLREVLGEIELVYANGAREKGLGFAFSIDPALPPTLLGDPLRLRQVLWNLVGNAIKFTERGAVEVRVGGGEAADGRVELAISVRDTGIGIAADQLKRVFEPFYQVEAAAARRFGGTGLGLPITQWLVDLMGGRLEIDSSPGLGSEFRVLLRLPRSSEAPASAPQPAADAPTRLRGLSVLLVEDHPINRHVAREILLGEGAEVDIAGDGQEAIARLRSHPSTFDVVLMDIQMPKMDGYEATRVIRDTLGLKQMPVIAMTANASPEDRAHSREAGMDDHLAKPIDVQTLVATLLRHARPGAPALETLAVPARGAAAGSAEPPVLALEQALARLAGHRTLYAQMARLFAQEQGESVRRLREALAQGDRVEAARAAHTLKGVAATLGAEALSSIAAQLERGLKRQTEPDELARMSDRLGEALAQAIIALERAAEELSPAADEAIPLAEFDRDAFARTLEALVLALVDSNMAALDHYAELRALATGALLTPLRAIEDALGRLDFGVALDACKRVEAALEKLDESAEETS
ncbi:MAG: hypothetical protein AMXMBFR25_11190 [Lysobacterales bacterium]